MTSFADRLQAACVAKKTSALVGLDPRLDWLPAEIKSRAREEHSDPLAAAAAAFEEFCVRIIDVVSPFVPAVKPQAAFFEEYGPDGCLALQRIIRYARSVGLLVICDAKRGDIGTTAEAYARAYIAGTDPKASIWGADALTVNPYLGVDTLEPFAQVAEERGGGIYVLVRTSNPGAAGFQDRSDGKRLFEHVAQAVNELTRRSIGSSGYGCVGAVVGATYPQELAELRSQLAQAPLLVPGYGAQGGTAADVVPAFHKGGTGALVNSSRGINFAFRQAPYQAEYGEAKWEAATEAAVRAMIQELPAVTASLG